MLSPAKRELSDRLKAKLAAAKKAHRQRQKEQPALVEQAKQASGAWDSSGRPIVPAKRRQAAR